MVSITIQDKIKAALLVVAAYEMYDHWAIDEPWTIDGMVMDFHAMPTDDSKLEPWGFIRHTGNSLQFVFKGTTSLDDWFADAEMAHGWQYIYDQLGPTLVHVAESAPMDYQIEIYAHSAGCQLARRFQNALSRDSLAIVFESPNDIVNNDKMHVVNNDHDLVTHVPKLPGYRQTGIIHQHDFNEWSIYRNHVMEYVLNNLYKLEKQNA